MILCLNIFLFSLSVCSSQIIATSLYSRKTFTSWEECEHFLNKWAKDQGFHVIKDCVTRESGIVRRRSFICDHSRTYEPSTTKDTSTKKPNCPFFVNASHPKSKNPQGFVFINKFNEVHERQKK